MSFVLLVLIEDLDAGWTYICLWINFGSKGPFTLALKTGLNVHWLHSQLMRIQCALSQSTSGGGFKVDWKWIRCYAREHYVTLTWSCRKHTGWKWQQVGLKLRRVPSSPRGERPTYRNNSIRLNGTITFTRESLFNYLSRDTQSPGSSAAWKLKT